MKSVLIIGMGRFGRHMAQKLYDLGFRRVSFGVQDYSEKVQKAINREQSFEMIDGIVKYLRFRNVESINFDLIYGLPNQTLNTIEDTFSKVVELNNNSQAIRSRDNHPTYYLTIKFFVRK